MKAILGNFVSVLGNDEKKNYEWRELMIKLGLLAMAVYLLIAIDITVYGYITGKL